MGSNQKNNTSFIEERNRRFKLISDLGLWQEITEAVRINGKPISVKTAKNTFKVSSYGKLKESMLRVWFVSDELVKKYENNHEQYADNQ